MVNASMIVYLAHPFTGAGLPDGPWRSTSRNTARVRALAAGIEATNPHIACRYSHGRADTDRSEAAILAWCLRLITGDSDPETERYVAGAGDRRGLEATGSGGPFGPHPVGRVGYAPAAAVWVVGPVSFGMEREIGHAAGRGIPVVAVDPEQQQAFIRDGERAAARATAEVTRRVVHDVLAGLLDAPDFRGARAVVSAFFLSESWELGGGTIDYEKRLGAQVQNGSGALAFRGSVETTALRCARASALMRDCGLTPDERTALRAREVEGHSYRGVALALGWPDDGAAEDRARRLAERAIRKVRNALRADEATREQAREEATA